jgi:RNase P subunit RPR2
MEKNDDKIVIKCIKCDKPLGRKKIWKIGTDIKNFLCKECHALWWLNITNNTSTK